MNQKQYPYWSNKSRRTILVTDHSLQLLNGLKQEPGPPLRLVDPVFNQAGRSDIVMPVADFMGGPKEPRQLQVVVPKLHQHVPGANLVVVIVLEALVPRDVADGMQRRGADLACPFGDVVGHREDLFGVFIQQQVVVAELRAFHVPMEILGFHIQAENVSKELPQRGGDLIYGVRIQVCWDFHFRSASYAYFTCHDFRSSFFSVVYWIRII